VFALKKRIKQFIVLILIFGILSLGTALSINTYVQKTGSKYILSPDEIPEADAVLVLGAYVFPDGTVSHVLNDRLSVGYELYEKGKASKIIVSGDHGRKDYDEVNAMKDFLQDKNVRVKMSSWIMRDSVRMKVSIVPGISSKSKK
jgi:vancomycin permeability regulator SanA